MNYFEPEELSGCPTLRQLTRMVEAAGVDERAMVETIITMVLKKFRTARLHVQTGREILIMGRLGLKTGDVFNGREAVRWLNENFPLYGMVNSVMYHNVYPSIHRVAQEGYFIREKEGYIRTDKVWGNNPILQKRMDWIDEEHRVFREKFPTLTIG